MRRATVATLLVTSLMAVGCGGSDSPSSTSSATASGTGTSSTDVSKVSQHDRQAAVTLTRHGRSWSRAYDRWDNAYRANHRAAFLTAAASQTPIMKGEADAAYQAAVSVDDQGLRGQYVKLARWYLRQTAAIELINSYVGRSDNTHFEGAVRRLDRTRAQGPKLAEDFQNYYQRRFGTNPFSNIETG